MEPIGQSFNIWPVPVGTRVSRPKAGNTGTYAARVLVCPEGSTGHGPGVGVSAVPVYPGYHVGGTTWVGYPYCPLGIVLLAVVCG